MIFIRSIVLFLLFSFGVNSCAQPQSDSGFYLGLTDSANAVRHFEKALDNPNVYARRAAVQELAALIDAGTELPQPTVKRVSQERERQWLIPSNEKETAALDAHIAISHLRYNEALVLFRAFQENRVEDHGAEDQGAKGGVFDSGEWPARIPELFLQHPVFINDLGRAFQYTSFVAEGLSLFLQWEKNLLADMSGAVLPDDLRPVFDNLNDARFRLVFYAARIARRVAQNTRSLLLFEEALALAPSPEQSDACIWYILDLSLSERTDGFPRRLEQYIPRWHGGNYYNDILEKYLQKITAAKEWQKTITVFNLIKDTDAAIKAAYAWVIARAIEEGFLSAEDMTAAGLLAFAPRELMRFAYNVLENDISSLLYYRAQSADVMGLPFLPEHLQTANAPIPAGRRGRTSTAKTPSQTAQPSAAAQFILGFFSNGAAEYAPKYIGQLENELSIEELRLIAAAYEQAGMYIQSIQLVSRYANRKGYTPVRRDIELLFPCPYRDLVEKYAEENNIAPEVLFGLIRTESAFQPSVISRSGAVGLTQLLPDTALDMANRIRRAGGPDYGAKGAVDLNDPDTNIHIGAFYLNYLMGRFEDELVSLLAYNGGMNRIRRLRAASTLPPDLFMETISIAETRDYGRKVLSAAAVYKALYY